MLRTFRIILSALAVIGCCAAAYPLAAATPTAKPEEVGLSTERLKRIAEVIQRYIADNSIPGAVTLVARDGRIAYHEAQGLMDVDAKKPMTKDAIFQMMSMTKPVIAVSVLMMVEEGKIRLQDPVSKFFPEWRNMTVSVPLPAPAGGRGGGAAGGGAPAGGAPGGRGAGATPAPRSYTMPAERELQIRDLLSHTSGISPGMFSVRRVAAGQTLADYVPSLYEVPLNFQPGTRWAYSAEGAFDTLARIVEITSGMSIDRFLKQRLFGPLEMKDTTFVTPAGNPRLVGMYSRSATGLRPSQYRDWLNGTFFSGSGGLFSTATDYAQFAMMLANNGELNGVRLLSPRTVDLMGSAFAAQPLPGLPRGEGYGLGVRVVTDSAAAGTLLSEGSFGWYGAFGTHFWVDRKERLVGLMMTQSGANQVLMGDFETAVMQAVVGRGTPGVSPRTN